MSEKYTKEAWFIENVDEEPLHVTSASRDGFIPVCIVQTGYEGQIEVEQQANARLIAAAPELLEALKELLSALDHQISDPDRVFRGKTAARAAIAKATQAM